MYALVILTKLFLFMMIAPLVILGGFMLLMLYLTLYSLVLLFTALAALAKALSPQA